MFAIPTNNKVETIMTSRLKVGKCCKGDELSSQQNVNKQ